MCESHHNSKTPYYENVNSSPQKPSQRRKPATKETKLVHSRTRAEYRSNKSTTHHKPPKQHITHLRPIPGLTAVHKPIRIIDVRELLPLRHRHLKEFAQWLPSLAHLVLEQVFWGHEGAQFGVVVVEDLLAVFVKVAFEEGGPEFV